MPPKKKGGKKGKKGKKSASEDDAANAGGKPGSASEDLDELGKEFFLIQVKDLEQRLARYQSKCDEVGKANDETEKKYIQLEQNRKETVDFLKKALETRQDDISDLHDKLLGLQQAKDTEKEKCEKQLSQLKREFQEIRDELTAKNMILGGKLSSLEEFKIQKEELMKKFADMEETFQTHEDNHTDKIDKLDTKAVLDKDRLKKEMVLRVNTVAADFRKVSNKQMADTTKRNIRENVSINSQLAKMSEKTKELVQENEELREREKNYKKQVKMLESSQEDLAKKNHSNLKVLKMITSRARQQEVILEELEARDEAYLQLDEESNMLRQENEQLSNQAKTLSDDLELKRNAMKNTMKEQDELSASIGNLEDILSATAYTLKQVVTETLEEESSESSMKSQTMIERLLVVLNSAALLEKSPPSSDLFQQRQENIMAPLSSAKTISGAGGASRVAARSQTLPHYKMGDLGLVPRSKKPSTKPTLLPNRVDHFSRSTQLVGMPDLKAELELNPASSNSFQQRDKLPSIGQANN